MSPFDLTDGRFIFVADMHSKCLHFIIPYAFHHFAQLFYMSTGINSA